ncbi:MurR/RpiR family transcriptional regulator [Streptosporangium saharense]|uniref:DNA-binding MurR/RpiR family transcriptional regulator n=1 Tax=Streptosporangium saharense TaxID=1706840 RepID=A0A7W7VSN7_9ACTN|nr:MurR/RpiR family transcriptional regulator [Streptosporangium saharense]MBB4920923.1 DNA-binding MurR/RpiR family transcriptional regulator [Streptosporangium saharense]
MNHDDAGPRLLRLFEGHRLTPAQRRIAHCLVQHAGEAAFLSSVEVAELAGVSQPSVTRFAMALGFDGYPALRRQLREFGSPETVVQDNDESDEEEAPNELQRAVLAEIAHLRRLAGALGDPKPVVAAARLLSVSRPLPVLGLRAAAAQAAGFSYFAAKVHPDVRLLDEGGSMLAERIERAAAAGASALLCFALPRYPAELTEALGVARDAGLSVVTVADSAFAPAAALSDVVLAAEVGTSLVFDTACGPMMLGRVLLEAMCDEIPGAEGRLEAFEVSAAAREIFTD